jgi:hypothetical protein
MGIKIMSTDLNKSFAAVDALGARAEYLDATGFAECSLDDDEATWAIWQAANAWANATDQWVRSEYFHATRRYRVHVIAAYDYEAASSVRAGWRSPLV